MARPALKPRAGLRRRFAPRPWRLAWIAGAVALAAAIAWQAGRWFPPPMQADVERLLAGRKGRYGVLVQASSGAVLASVNADEEFPAASTIKLPLVLYLYELADGRRVDLNEPLAYIDEDYEGGTGWIQGDPRTTYTLAELAEAAIRSSDNIAANMLTRRLGRTELTRFMSRLGARTVSRVDPTSSPRDMVRFLREADRFASRSPLGRRLIEHLRATDFPGRLAASVPPGSVGHKIGSIGRSVNDVGIVWGRPGLFGWRSKTYVAVLTRDVEPREAEEVIARLGRLVYDAR